ncbi:MAG: LysR family transcriptional regulator [Sulfolobaceae archaeon]
MGGIQLLKKINEVGSISKASRNLNMSYKFAWEYVKNINQKIGGIEMKKGGRGAGGSLIDSKLLKLIAIYDEAVKEISEVIEKYNKKLNEEINK